MNFDTCKKGDEYKLFFGESPKMKVMMLTKEGYEAAAELLFDLVKGSDCA